ncbi:MmgE/PrpD family protein [Jatrophihabitans endophyticus]|uniref:MmgE/PrpD family protein n=1 Tax=Jatrophihabitans endophyticus TaxID=1206085 RepID=UPI0013563A4E|nr:MmgE/PrpD family protein [Jatrophihabitans endophyticus]
MTLTDLAHAAASVDLDDVPGEVADRTVDVLVDTIGAAALGSGRPEVRALQRTFAVTAGAPARDGGATAVGAARGWPAAAAAFLNGCAVVADQLQDGHRLARGHPGAHTVPAALALGETLDVPLAEVAAAALAGYEVGVRVGRAMGGTPTGVHDIGTWGQVAVSATVARLLAPGDGAAMRRAIELSASAVLLTDAGTVFAGRTGSHAFLGASIQHGLTLGQAAVAGLVAEPGTIERHLLAVASPRAAAATPAGADWGTWEILAGYLKRHPTCAHLHGVNDAVAVLLADGGVPHDRVVAVEVAVFAGAAGFDAIADTELAARFSIPTSVAIALVTGRLDETVTTDATVRSATVRALAARVRVRHDPALDDGYPAGRPARVTVTLADGSARTAVVGRPAWDGDRLPPPGAVDAKARRLLTARFGPAGGQLVDLVRGGADPTAVGRALRGLADDAGQYTSTASSSV